MGQFLQFAFLGLSAGAIYAVFATSLVGVYAATGIINFAQGAIGLYSVFVVAALRTDGSLVLPIGTLYLGSEKNPTPMELALLIGVLSAVVWGLLAHFLVFRPLRHAPVLAQVVASVGLMLLLQALVQLRFDTENLVALAVLPEGTVEFAGAVINQSDLILAAVAIGVAVLWAYFRLTTLGVATRAGSEDELAARLTGFSPDRLAAIVWALTGAELLDAASAVIAEVGAERATMDMIAERGGTTRVTLYAHFGSRDTLVARVIERELDKFTTFMFAVYDESVDMQYGARARYTVESLFDYARRHPDGLRILIGHREGGDDPAGRRLYAALEPRIAARLRANYAERGARIDASADTLASLLLVMSLDVAHRALFVDGTDIDAACDLAVTATLAVLRDVRAEQLQAIDASLPAVHPAG
ncbi:ABC transporter permease subunit [Gordonia bronchialis]|uniref:ABC transporter permease subunit n=1 Tax=Gordonia bronchialis TaxID=2054 RepID=UPI003C6D5C52